MKSTGTFLFVLCILINCDAQILRKPLAAAYAGIAAYGTAHNDVFSFSANQASLAQLKNTAAALYSERKFLLTALASYNAVVAITTPHGNFGLEAAYAGSRNYNEAQLGLAYARKLGSRVDAGVQFNYNHTAIMGYGHASAIGFEVGSVFHLSDQLHTGIHVSNPVGGKFGNDQEEKLASAYTLGMGYEASPQFFAGLEIVKEEDLPATVNAGIQYKFLPQLLARVGVSVGSSSLWTGFGFLWQAYRIDVTLHYHPQLGITPGLLIAFNFKKKEA